MIFSAISSEQERGNPRGITSICSANRFVIESSIRHAKTQDNNVLIEATSNQVDQYGGYTGMTPDLFRKYVYNIAETLEFPTDKIVLGGDHLGPNVWQNETSDSAMKKAEEQIAAYVSAGFRKIHLDTSFVLGDDDDIRNNQLAPEIITKRAAQLCKISERTYKNNSDQNEKPVYVIGTEVPMPGGALENEEIITNTSVTDLENTIELSKEAFCSEGLEDAWDRVIAIVVQPGVEFSDNKVFPYVRENNQEIIKKIESFAAINFEAHSTDYQSKQALTEMVEDHFAILKVGPWLTFALREALFSLASIEDEIQKCSKSITPSNFRKIVEDEMTQNPKYWINHYHGTEAEIGIARLFSYSDRIRYYWSNKNINSSLNVLLNNLDSTNIPESLVSQYLPMQYSELKESKIENNPRSFINSKISRVLSIYQSATGEISEE